MSIKGLRPRGHDRSLKVKNRHFFGNFEPRNWSFFEGGGVGVLLVFFSTETDFFLLSLDFDLFDLFDLELDRFDLELLDELFLRSRDCDLFFRSRLRLRFDLFDRSRDLDRFRDLERFLDLDRFDLEFDN